MLLCTVCTRSHTYVAMYCMYAFTYVCCYVLYVHVHIRMLLCTVCTQVGGSEGRKKAVESGILSITVKLLRARDPIPV